MDRHLRASRRAIKSFLAPCLALVALGCAGNEANRFPTSSSYPASTMTRMALTAGVPEAWSLSAMSTNHPNAPWKLVIITGTPSWSEYWAPLLAAAPQDLEIIVADRPGFKDSGPDGAVTDIATQARALSVLLEPTAMGQKVILAGQSYGGPISTLMAANNREKVAGLILLSAFFGERGPTIHGLSLAGSIGEGLIGRDMKNGLAELRNQKPQLPAVFAALDSLTLPVVVLHGEKDSFVTMAAARRLAVRSKAPLIEVPKGDHFLNACCVGDILGAVGVVQGRVNAAEN